MRNLSLLFVSILLISCQPSEPLKEVKRVEPPKKVYTPSAMLQQCVEQPRIVYCQKRCDDTKNNIVGRPSWCKK